MSSSLSRRKLITGGLSVAGGAAGLAAAARLADRYGLIPPDSGGVWGPGETFDLRVPADPDIPPFDGSRIQPRRNFESGPGERQASQDGPLSGPLGRRIRGLAALN